MTPTVILRKLISCRLVLVKVMFPIKLTPALYIALECNSSSESGQQRGLLKDLRRVQNIARVIAQCNIQAGYQEQQGQIMPDGDLAHK